MEGNGSENGNGKWKASRYNHFVEIGDGKRLAFNALTCGLAEMDEQTYQLYLDIVAGGEFEYTDGQEQGTITELCIGGFITTDDGDELNLLRAAHYRSRFGNRGLGLTLVPTLACNFSCDYCYENPSLSEPASRQRMSDKVSANVIRFCERRLKRDESLNVTWYGGEPLLALDLILHLTSTLSGLCESLKRPFNAGLVTNGYLMTEQVVASLIGIGIRSAQVTVDGPREVHDARRRLKNGGGTYDTIMANLAKITPDSGMQVAIRINIDRRNRPAIPRLLYDLAERGFNRRPNFVTYFGHVQASASACPNVSSECMVTDEFSEFLVDAHQLLIEHGFRYHNYPSRMLNSCGAVSGNTLVIEPSGHTQSCWHTIGDHKKSIGVLTSDGLQSNDNQVKWLGWTPFTGECTACSVLPICMRGCPYRTIYPEDAEDYRMESCVTWRHNLSKSLPMIKHANDCGLLAIRGASSSDRGRLPSTSSTVNAQDRER